MDDVDIEQALETQRLKLLRLLARWAVMLGVLSVGPVALPVPCWVRAFFETLVIRAEMATKNLVRVSACLQVTGGVMVAASQPRACSDQGMVVPSAQDLLRRVNTLRDRLENLSCVARRLLCVRMIAGAAFDFSAPSHLFAAPKRVAMTRADWVLPRVERPPDKVAA